MKKVKKNICLWAVATGLMMTPMLFAGESGVTKSSQEHLEVKKGQMLCQIAERAFESARGAEGSLSGLGALDLSKCEKVLLANEPGAKPLMTALKNYMSVEEAQKDIYLEGVISNVGRLLKNSVDNPTHHLKYNHCLVHRQDLKMMAGEMESVMGQMSYANLDYHKLMIESLADKKYDVALYAYVKIAEDRCN